MLALASAVAAATSRPIIGVLALPIEHGDCITFHDATATSCFHSLYAVSYTHLTLPTILLV